MKKLLLLFVAGSTILLSQAAVTSTETDPNTKTSSEASPIPDDIAVQHAMTEFKSLSRVDRKARVNEAKKMMAEYKAQKASGEGDVSTNKILLAILAILLPPLAVG